MLISQTVSMDTEEENCSMSSKNEMTDSVVVAEKIGTHPFISLFSSAKPSSDENINLDDSTVAISESSSSHHTRTTNISLPNGSLPSRSTMNDSIAVSSEGDEVVDDSAVVSSESDEAVDGSIVVSSEGEEAVDDSIVISSESDDAADNSIVISSESDDAVDDAIVVSSQSGDAVYDSTVVSSEGDEAVNDSVVISSESEDADGDSMIASSGEAEDDFQHPNSISVRKEETPHEEQLIDELNPHEIMEASKYSEECIQVNDIAVEGSPKSLAFIAMQSLPKETAQLVENVKNVPTTGTEKLSTDAIAMADPYVSKIEVATEPKLVRCSVGKDDADNWLETESIVGTSGSGQSEHGIGTSSPHEACIEAYETQVTLVNTGENNVVMGAPSSRIEPATDPTSTETNVEGAQLQSDAIQVVETGKISESKEIIRKIDDCRVEKLTANTVPAIKSVQDSSEKSRDDLTYECNKQKPSVTCKTDVVSTNEQREQIPSLTQRMKEMFDSPSPDEPSSAFGKTFSVNSKREAKTNPRGSSLAKDMKLMFDSPSPDSPSTAFSSGKLNFEKSKESNVDQAKEDTNKEVVATGREKNKKDTIIQCESQGSASMASQMVSLLWASSSREPDHGRAQEETTEAVTRDTTNEEAKNVEVVKDEFIQKNDEAHFLPDPQVKNNDAHPVDHALKSDNVISVLVTTEDMEGTIHESKDYTDDRGFEEFTAEASEYEETTIVEGEVDFAVEMQEFKIENIESVVDVTAKSESMISPLSSTQVLNLSEGHESSRVLFSTPKRSSEVPQNSKKKSGILSESQTAEATVKRDSKIKNASGSLAERLKMFDSFGDVPDKPFSFCQNKMKSKVFLNEPHAERTEHKTNRKDQPELLSLRMRKTICAPPFAEKKSAHFEFSEKDLALAKQIICLAKEPGAMLDKISLAHRIVSILTDDLDIGKENSLDVICHEPCNQKGTETYTSSELTNDHGKCTRSEQEDVALVNEKVDGISPPDVSSVRVIKRINIKQLKAQKSRQESATNINASEMDDKCDGLIMSSSSHRDALIDRIWPKSQNVEKPRPKPWMKLSHDKTSENIVKHTPKKLGERLKQFESQSQTPSSALTPRSNRKRKDIIRPKDKETNTDEETNTKDSFTCEVNKRTAKSISSFQRLWRKYRSKLPRDQTRGKVLKLEGIKSESDTKNTPRKNVTFSVAAEDQRLDGERVIQRALSKEATCPQTFYTLQDFEMGRVDGAEVNMEQWEDYLDDHDFSFHFGMSKKEFFQQPKWKRDKQKRKVRVAF